VCSKLEGYSVVLKGLTLLSCWTSLDVVVCTSLNRSSISWAEAVAKLGNCLDIHPWLYALLHGPTNQGTAPAPGHKMQQHFWKAKRLLG
jgi:hypothetical protein